MRAPYWAFALLALISFFSFFGDFIYTTSPYTMNKNEILLPPSLQNPFGTDRLGRDIFARVIKGGEISLIIGVGSAIITSIIGLIVGLSAGFFRGVVDRGIVILIDLFLTFPTFFLLIALASYVNASVLVLIAVISITSWMGMARLIRSESFRISDKPFIKILKVAKVKKSKIFFKYLTPLLFSIFLINFTFGVGGTILAESGLSFLGLGVQPPSMSLGSVLSEGRDVMDIAWWVSFFPGLIIFLITLCLMRISDYLQNRFDQREKIE